MLTTKDVDIVLEALPEDMPVRGNLVVSDEPELDRAEEDKVLADLEWNEWAWACAHVRVTDPESGLSADAYIGGCSYNGEDDFRSGGYYEDMVAECLDDLNTRIAALVARHASEGRAR